MANEGLSPFSEEHRMFRSTLRSFIGKEITPHVDEWEKQELVPRWVWKRMGEMGFLGLRYPEEYGGLDADYWYTVVFAEELARIPAAGVGMGLLVQTDMATPALARHGSEVLKSKYLAGAIRGEYICSLAVTEAGAGSDVANTQTRARLDGDHYVVSGRKMFITNGTQADFITTLCRTDISGGHRGFSLLVIPTDLPGFSVGRKLKKLGNHCSDTAEIVFDDVRVPVSHRIGDEGQGFVYQMQQFQDERLIASINGMAAAFHIYEQTKTYAMQREVFGKPVSVHQVNRHRFVDMLTQLTALRAMVYECANRFNHGEDATQQISMCKVFAEQVSKFVIDTCLQMHGGYGYMEEFPVARAYRNNRVFSIAGGSDEVMKEIVAKLEGLKP